MGTNFTGSDTWVATCTGPANDDDLTAESCTDMGVQLANRTIFLGERIDTSHQWRLVAEITTTDSGSAYASVSTHNTTSWGNMGAYVWNALDIGSIPGALRVHWQGTIGNTSTDWAELRLRVDDNVTIETSPHWRIPESTTIAAAVELITDKEDWSGSIKSIGLRARLSNANNDIQCIGSGRLTLWKLTPVTVT